MYRVVVLRNLVAREADLAVAAAAVDEKLGEREMLGTVSVPVTGY